MVALTPKVSALANPTNWLVLCSAATARGFDGVLPVASMSLFTMPGIQSSTYNVGYAFCRMLVPCIAESEHRGSLEGRAGAGLRYPSRDMYSRAEASVESLSQLCGLGIGVRRHGAEQMRVSDAAEAARASSA